MILQIDAVSNCGCVRSRNEDMVLVGTKQLRDGEFRSMVDLATNEPFFVAVADGVGGHLAGDIASNMVMTEIGSKIVSLSKGLTPDQLADIFTVWTEEIHAIISNSGDIAATRKGMGSTLIGVLFYESNVYYINVGDSRLYYYSDKSLSQISRDHTLREFSGNPQIPSNIIVNSFGGGVEVFCDFDILPFKFLKNDKLLLCSDGLSDMLKDDEIATFLQTSSPIRNLLQGALDNGGLDNVSFVVITSVS